MMNDPNLLGQSLLESMWREIFSDLSETAAKVTLLLLLADLNELLNCYPTNHALSPHSR